VRRELEDTKLLIGVFMSPFDVHVNRAPIAGTVRSVEHHPAVYRNHHMGTMHLRSLLKRIPIYLGSRHIETNERTVTSIDGMFKGDPVSCHVVQIAGGSVRGIHSYVLEGERLAKGDIFGEIRVGSQVDLVVTWRDSMRPRVKPGDKVKAGLTVMVD
jgi:phosphatidylserine decarboxylase